MGFHCDLTHLSSPSLSLLRHLKLLIDVREKKGRASQWDTLGFLGNVLNKSLLKIWGTSNA